MVEILLQLDLGEEIPSELYQAVAEILIFVYRLNDEWKKTRAIQLRFGPPEGLLG